MTVVVVGAGIAGLACARELVDAGVPVRVVERDAVVGGRLASVSRGGRPVDIGAAYVTADDPAFLGQVQSWRVAGLARPWTDTFRSQHGAGPMRWAAPGGLRSLAVDLARGLDVTLGVELSALPAADVVVLAMPGPQALRLTPFAAAREQVWSPVLTAVLTYPSRSWDDFAGAFVNDHPVLTTVCDDGDRRGDRAPVLVAHARPDENERSISRAVGDLLGITAEPAVELFRWPLAQPRPGEPPYAQAGNVFLCGDAFGKPRVQTAWLSGRAVARAIVQSTLR